MRPCKSNSGSVFRFSASLDCRNWRRNSGCSGCRHQRASRPERATFSTESRNFVRVRQELTDLPHLRVRQLGLKRRHSGEANPIGRLPVGLETGSSVTPFPRNNCGGLEEHGRPHSRWVVGRAFHDTGHTAACRTLRRRARYAVSSAATGDWLVDCLPMCASSARCENIRSNGMAGSVAGHRRHTSSEIVVKPSSQDYYGQHKSNHYTLQHGDCSFFLRNSSQKLNRYPKIIFAIKLHSSTSITKGQGTESVDRGFGSSDSERDCGARSWCLNTRVDDQLLVSNRQNDAASTGILKMMQGYARSLPCEVSILQRLRIYAAAMHEFRVSAK